MNIISTDPVSKDTLYQYAHDFPEPSPSLSNLLIPTLFTIISMTILATISITTMKRIENERIKNIIFVIIMTLAIIVGCITILVAFHVKKERMIDYEYKHNHPHYQTLSTNGTIDAISNGSNRETQELRFSKQNTNYYIKVPSDVAIRSGDTIRVNIKHQLVDNVLKTNNLSQSYNKPESDITIKHNGKTKHTHGIFDSKN